MLKNHFSLCKRIDRELDKYYDGQLDSERVKMIESHVKTCEACSRELDSFAGLTRLLRNLKKAELQNQEFPSFWLAIRSALVNQPEHGFARIPLRWRQPWRIMRPAGLGMAVAATVLLLMFLSTIFLPPELPANFCRIESISAPEHQLMIYQGKEDGFTIIWLLR